ncbi:MAG TPA: phosphohistidine phosphatase SixA [Gemmataceae bacterium]|nr:phosphohistidine phosphatase SixA [Gemmataceae bacterium]
MNLYVIRHADAGSREEWEGDDQDRPLSDLGRQQARALGEAFHRHGITIDAVFTSPYARAWQTAADFREAAQPDGKEPEPYHLLAPEVGKRRKLAKFLASVGVENVAIVGHDPDLPAFLAWLVGCEPENIDLEKGGAACVRFDGDPQKHGGQLAWVVTPDWFMAGATAEV